MGLYQHTSDVLCLTKRCVGDSLRKEEVAFKPVGRVVEQGDWNGVPIVKEMPDPGFHNPITVQDLKNALQYFALSPHDMVGLQVIIISGRSPYTDEMNAGWAFGAYQVIWEEASDIDKDSGKRVVKHSPKQNRLILWAQKIDLVRFNLGDEIRQGYYYRVNPEYQGAKVDRYLSVKALRREILGDTIIHEIGHHVDIWQYGRYVENSKDRAKAEKFAEAYSRAHNKGKWDKPEFDTIIDGTYPPAKGQQQPGQQQPDQQPGQPDQPPQEQAPQAAPPQAPRAPQVDQPPQAPAGQKPIRSNQPPIE